MGIGHGSGEDRAEEAAKAAISSPLLESSIEGARGVLLSVSGPTDLTLHEVNRAADHITRVAHPDANIIFGAVVDDALGEEIRVTVIAAGFDKLAAAPAATPFESRLTRFLEEPQGEPEPVSVAHAPAEEAEAPAPSILVEEEDEIFRPATEPVSFDAEEDLDIPDFLKS
jgi:cell division protein FtsZ